MRRSHHSPGIPREELAKTFGGNCWESGRKWEWEAEVSKRGLGREECVTKGKGQKESGKKGPKGRTGGP